MNLSQYIDHTLLKPTATEADIIKLCKEAIEYRFATVCVNGNYIGLAKRYLQNSNVKVCAVIGFPLGATPNSIKLEEVKHAIDHGADEIDMVIDLGKLKSKQHKGLITDIKTIKNAIPNHTLKVIIETCYLTDDEIKMATKLVNKSGADYIKTSTGFGSRGATLKDIKLIKEIANPVLKIKASGGIRDYDTAMAYINLGVSRIGTSSGVKIVS